MTLEIIPRAHLKLVIVSALFLSTVQLLLKGAGVSKNFSGLVVLQAGVQSSLQDLGRYGQAGQGISQGGVIDLHAHCWANQLLDNDANEATVEMTVGMAKFRAESDLQLAISGADMSAELDGEAVGNWRSFPVKRGQILSMKAASTGMRAYLAVAGGFSAKNHFGSVSTVLRNQLGDLLKDGDVLAVRNVVSCRSRQVPDRYIPHYGDAIQLRVIESYQADRFLPEQLEMFYASEFSLTPEMDRMGARLDGGVVTPPEGGIVSEGIALGSIQIPPDGQPIILLNDRQTLGGYPKLGCLARVDLAKLAQARPGTKVQFAPVSIARATDEWREFCDYFRI